MAERLQELISSFNVNLRQHYEAQANAIQVDISLILRANPYANTPLEDGTDEIEAQIAAVVGDKMSDPIAREGVIAEAGKLYSEYIKRGKRRYGRARYQPQLGLRKCRFAVTSSCR